MKTGLIVISVLALCACATRAPAQLSQRQIDAQACKVEAKKADAGNSTAADAVFLGLPYALIERHKRTHAAYAQCMAGRGYQVEAGL